MKVTSAFVISAAVLVVLLVVKPADSCSTQEEKPKGWRQYVVTNKDEPYEDDNWKMLRTSYRVQEKTYQPISSEHHRFIDHEIYNVDDNRINKPKKESHRWVDHNETTVTHDFRRNF
ncbi:uncharacterized protein LOC141527348 [Cotesia typhae]|uniref:uncharacterized protein LOC141527348 n=1 Tax=Cotesia typhae TaxID=2053667 RepID=UPI003D695403